MTRGGSHCFSFISIEFVLIGDEGKLRTCQVLGNVRLCLLYLLPPPFSGFGFGFFVLLKGPPTSASERPALHVSVLFTHSWSGTEELRPKEEGTRPYQEHELRPTRALTLFVLP
jgi:hypothetical protein